MIPASGRRQEGQEFKVKICYLGQPGLQERRQHTHTLAHYYLNVGVPLSLPPAEPLLVSSKIRKSQMIENLSKTVWPVPKSK